MESVIVASKNEDEARLICETFKKAFNVTPITSPEDFEENKNSARLVLLDQNFTEKYGLDFLTNPLKSTRLPVIYLADPDDIKAALEALKRGACNVIPKIPNFCQLLFLLAQTAITEFNEKQKLFRGIKILKKKVEDFESSEIKDHKQAQDESDSDETKEQTILDHIMYVFRRGEIDLPSPPQIGIKFRELLSKGSSLDEIGGLLSKDMAISSKLISISNSAYYRGMTENKNLTQAISRLGVDITKQYVEAILNRSLYITQNKNFKSYIESLWEHSLSCAYAAQLLKETLNLNLVEDAFTLGLLHDIGKLVLFRVIAELQIKKKLGDSIDSTELLDTVNDNHDRFGASALKLWKFSDEYIRAASYHDNMESADHISKDLMVVNFANQLVKSMGYGEKESLDVDLVSMESASLLKLDEESIGSVKEKLRQVMEELGGYLK